MTDFNKDLKIGSRLRREEEAVLFGDYAVYDHQILLTLEQRPIKDLQTHTEILSLREMLKAQVRDYPEIVKLYPVLERYKSC